MHTITGAHGLYGSLLIAGIVGGFTHCVAMCGPFVLSQAGHMTKLSAKALLPYHAGRITTYTVLAILLSSVLNTAFLFLPIRSFVVAPVLMVAGIIFIVTAFPSLTQIFPWTSRINTGVPYQLISKGFESLSRRNIPAKGYLMGVLLGFMPCGLIVSALMAAATAETVTGSALAMIMFGAGTMPALMTVAYGGGFLQDRYPNGMRRVTQVMMLWSGLWLFAIAGFLLI